MATQFLLEVQIRAAGLRRCSALKWSIMKKEAMP